jgi:uroporphyrinogen decarboxylase
MLTPRENFLRMVRRQEPAWLPLGLPVTPPVADLIEKKTGTRDVVAAFSTDFRSTWVEPKQDRAIWRAAHAAIGFSAPPTAEIGSYGVTHDVPARETLGAGYHFREMLHPLSVVTDVAQLKQLPWPDMADPHHYDSLAEEVARCHAEGRVFVGGRECTLFEDAWYVRGMDYLFSDLIEGNGIGDWLLDWFTERSVHVVTAYANAGVDVIALGDDVGTQRGMMISVDFWREHLRPRLQRVIDAIRAAQHEKIWIRYHSDGDIRDVVPDLIEVGVDILNPVQPECMPPAEVIPAYQRQLGFWGIVGTQTTMPFGSPDAVRQVVADCAGWARGGAGIVVAPTHVLEPDVPWENIVALVEAVRATRL